MFHGANAGKRSITLALDQPDGLTLAKRLIAGADAVIENFSPRVMENFGLDWDAVHTCNARAVMVRTGAGAIEEQRPPAGLAADTVVDNLAAAASWILMHR